MHVFNRVLARVSFKPFSLDSNICAESHLPACQCDNLTHSLLRVLGRSIEFCIPNFIDINSMHGGAVNVQDTDPGVHATFVPRAQLCVHLPTPPLTVHAGRIVSVFLFYAGGELPKNSCVFGPATIVWLRLVWLSADACPTRMF